ncbi:MAG: hypothetical protein H6707_01045 [Deltaproteobacteria bacterium]|nr:hypothetical protein [Deltaproteobacteria bacterium]
MRALISNTLGSVGRTLTTAGRYVVARPKTVAGLARHAAAGRLAIPLDALRWLAESLISGKNAPRDLTIEARPPGIHLGATVKAMGATIRAAITVALSDIEISPSALRFTINLSDLDVKPVGDANPSSPIVGLLNSGALDLSKPGNLLALIPSKPAAIVRIAEDHLVVDLFEVASIGQNPTVGKVLRALTPVLTISELRTAGDMLLIGFRVMPRGLSRR